MNNASACCPVCEKTSKKQISSDLFRCGRCGLIFNNGHRSLSYDRDYFISEYKAQYGKTYLDDFDNIYRLSVSRVEKILNLIKTGPHPLAALDIGSAAGFFLKAAKDRGIAELKGIEISEFAAEHCIKNFNIPVIRSPFESAEINENFDIITSWFFLEHLAEPLKAITKIYSMLNNGGVFAMAVPSCFGPLYCFDRSEFVRTHPKDHRIDLSPKAAKRVLKSAGFRKIRVIRCGYHPERVIKRDSIFFRPFEMIYRLFTTLTGFSDTIEIYALK